ncbi:MAG TPA: hypothetical protein VGZ04_06790 [Acidimicrobiales bacterium]|jgi:hypothetical protein|nr:hypothetical protein [Acidimicrobiales bacterium]
MLDITHGEWVELHLGVVGSPSGSGLVLLDGDEDETRVVFRGYAPDFESDDRREALAIITAKRCLQSVFGYPNEEAYWLDERGSLGIGIYELIGSMWAENVAIFNDRTYWRDKQEHRDFLASHGISEMGPIHSSQLRHFFIGSKDSSVQLLAEELLVEIIDGKSFGEVISEAVHRMLNSTCD